MVEKEQQFLLPGSLKELPLVVPNSMPPMPGGDLKAAVEVIEASTWRKKVRAQVTKLLAGAAKKSVQSPATEEASLLELLRSHRQSDVLVGQLTQSAVTVRSKLQRRNEEIAKEYYRVVLDASRLLSCCRQKPSLDSAIMLLDTHNNFRSILLDLDFCMRAMPTDDAGSASNMEQIHEYLENAEARWKHKLKDAAQKDQITFRSKLAQKLQDWTTTQVRLLSQYLLKRLVRNGNFQPFIWTSDPQAKVEAIGRGKFARVQKSTWFGLECAKKSFKNKAKNCVVKK